MTNKEIIALDGNKVTLNAQSLSSNSCLFYGANNVEIMRIDIKGVITFNPDIEQTEAAGLVIKLIQELNAPYIQRLAKAEEDLQKACDLFIDTTRFNIVRKTEIDDFLNKHSKWVRN